MLRWTRLLLVCALLLVTLPLRQTHAQGGSLPLYEPYDCPFDPLPGQTEGETYECGYLSVPENRANPDSPAIALAVVIVYSASPSPLPDPIIYLEGGPGGSAIAGLDAWIGTPLAANRNIILVDQRGTGYSEPSLNCWELDEMEDQFEAESACFDRLVSEGIDLTAYNSHENAADIADLRLALGLEEVNLYGVSYGTRLALTVLRDHPEGVRSVVIDGVYPPHVQGYEEQPINGARAFDQLFTDCAADPACSAAFPDLEATFYQLVEDLNASPVIVNDEEYGETELTGDSLVNALFQAFYATSIVPNLPLAITLIAEGEASTGMALVQGLSPQDLYGEAPAEDAPVADENTFLPYDIDSDAEGMFNAVECYEEVPFQTYDRAAALSMDIVPQIRDALLAGVSDQFETCAVWRSETAPALENAPVTSGVPTLVLSGAYDPITPPAWGQAAADYLSQSYHYVFPGVGHGSIDGGDCPITIATAFLNDPSRTPEASCIAAMRVNFFTGMATDGMVEASGETADDVEAAILALLDDLNWSLDEFETDFLEYNAITMDDLVNEILDGTYSLEELAAILSE